MNVCQPTTNNLPNRPSQRESLDRLDRYSFARKYFGPCQELSDCAEDLFGQYGEAQVERPKQRGATCNIAKSLPGSWLRQEASSPDLEWLICHFGPRGQVVAPGVSSWTLVGSSGKTRFRRSAAEGRIPPHRPGTFVEPAGDHPRRMGGAACFRERRCTRRREGCHESGRGTGTWSFGQDAVSSPLRARRSCGASSSISVRNGRLAPRAGGKTRCTGMGGPCHSDRSGISWPSVIAVATW